MNRGLAVRKLFKGHVLLFLEPPASALLSIVYPSSTWNDVRWFVSSTKRTCMPMKPGDKLEALKIFKDQEAPVVLKRDEYPDWINSLAEKDVSLAQLRKMDESEATDRQKMRFLKLTRRIEIRQKNEAAKAK